MRYLFLLSLVGVLYGSLYPFTFTIMELDKVDFADVLSVSATFDMLNNVALFVPVGVLARLSASEDKRKVWTYSASALFVAALAQLFQAFVPERYPGLWDVVMNAVGLVFGLGLASILGQWIKAQAEDASALSAPAGLLISAFFVYQLYPFVPAMDWSFLKASIMSTYRMSRIFNGATVFQYAVYWLVISALLFPMVRKKEWRVVFLFLPFAIFVLRIIIWRNVPNLWQLSGALIGEALYFVLAGRKTLPMVLVAALFSAILLEGITPFYWRPAELSFALIPFESVLRGSPHSNVLALSQKMFLYGSLVWCAWQVWDRKFLITLVVAAYLGAVEAAQVYIASGRPEVSDAILVVIMAFVLHAVKGRPAT
jgi:VanZ family protein